MCARNVGGQALALSDRAFDGAAYVTLGFAERIGCANLTRDGRLFCR